MWISRIRVTGGFLAGLDLTFTDGLNVVIGPRGAGKTTLLELIRHAVGALHADHAKDKKRQAFLAAILGSGEIIVDIESDDGGRHLVVDAKGGGQRADLSASVLVLGQNELEEIASDAPSRLNLLDLRMGVSAALPSSTGPSAMTSDLFDIRTELDSRGDEAAKRVRLTADRQLFASQEAALLGGDAGQLTAQRDQLRIAEQLALQAGQDVERIGVLQSELADVLEIQTRQATRLEDLRRSAAGIQQESIAQLLELATRLADELSATLTQGNTELDQLEGEARLRNVAAREAAAPIRESLEKAETGLGQITSQLRNIDSELRTLDDNDAAITRLKRRQADLITQRTTLFDQTEQAEEALYQARAEVARATTSQIGSSVVVVVEHLADYNQFRSFLQDALKGSSTRSALIDAVSERVLPRQLLTMIEERNAEGLSAVSGITPDRALRLIENLDRKEILRDLAQVRLLDSVDFRLHDGAVDKSVDLLSTGQKCAVTLPIVLSEQQRTLILDQPEDHLDNAYLVRNVIHGLVDRRKNGAQTIVATHNANIPVLGSADQVVVLNSDGKNGSVGLFGRFDEDEVVKTITSLMEGGRTAFARRLAFYEEHGGLE